MVTWKLLEGEGMSDSQYSLVVLEDKNHIHNRTVERIPELDCTL